jgi:hypothetical protein
MCQGNETDLTLPDKCECRQLLKKISFFIFNVFKIKWTSYKNRPYPPADAKKLINLILRFRTYSSSFLLETISVSVDTQVGLYVFATHIFIISPAKHFVIRDCVLIFYVYRLYYMCMHFLKLKTTAIYNDSRTYLVNKHIIMGHQQ